MSDVAGFSVRPVEAADREQWSELYRGYRAFYQEADDDTKVATTWGFLMDPANESNGIVAVDDSGALIGMAVWREFSRPLEAEAAIDHADAAGAAAGADDRTARRDAYRPAPAQ